MRQLTLDLRADLFDLHVVGFHLVEAFLCAAFLGKQSVLFLVYLFLEVDQVLQLRLQRLQLRLVLLVLLPEQSKLLVIRGLLLLLLILKEML